MDDKSFVNLISDDVLNEIKIDTRLKAPFKRVVKKLQAYFNANGYTTQRDYKTFFEENLIGKNFKIYVSDEPSKIGALGFYSKAKQCICIDEGLLEKLFLLVLLMKLKQRCLQDKYILLVVLMNHK